MYDGIGVFPRYTAKQTVEQRVRCLPTRPERLVRPQRHYLCPSRVWCRFSKGSSRFDPYGSPVITMSKQRPRTNEAYWVWKAICRGFTPDLLADPKHKPAILCSEERRLRTRNRGNIYHCSYFHLISGDANDLSCMLKAEEI